MLVIDHVIHEMSALYLYKMKKQEVVKVYDLVGDWLIFSMKEGGLLPTLLPGTNQGALW